MAVSLNDVIGLIGTGILMVIATTEAAVTFIMSFKCTKVYMSSAPDYGIADFVKKTIFMVFMLCSCISMPASVLALMTLFRAKLWSSITAKAGLFLQALALVQIAFEYMLMAFVVVVCLMMIATIEAAVTFIMGITCIKVYMSSAPDSDIVKKTIFMVFMLCNYVPMVTCAVAVMALFWAKLLSDLTAKASLFVYAMELVKNAFVSILVAFIVGVALWS